MSPRTPTTSPTIATGLVMVKLPDGALVLVRMPTTHQS